MTFHLLLQEWIRLGLGVLTLLFVAQRLLLPPDAAGSAFSKPTTVGLATLGGFTSFVAHTGGPALKMILLSHNLPNRQFVATNSYLFAAVNVLRILAQRGDHSGLVQSDHFRCVGCDWGQTGLGRLGGADRLIFKKRPRTVWFGHG